MPRDVALLDTNSLIGMGNTSYALGRPNLMDALKNPTFNLAVTSTVVGEATRNQQRPDAALIGGWLTSSIDGGAVRVIDTPAFRPDAGIRKMGDDSIADLVEKYTGLAKLTIVSDDRRLVNRIGRINNKNVNTANLQSFIESSLLSGGVNYADYVNISLDKGWAPLGVSFRNMLTNGVAIEAVPEGLIVTDVLGVEHIIAPNEKFSVTSAGFVSKIDNFCFAAGTAILMIDGSEKTIEAIRPGDLVASFNETADGGRGALVGKRVVRTFVNENQIVIDFHGTKVTPGHAYLCGDGPHEGRFKQIMNIVRADGAVVLADGTQMRAATGCHVGSPGDTFVELQIARPARNKLTGESVTLLKERGRIRAGTRIQRPDGSFFSFLDLIEANGWTLHEDGLVSQGPGHAPEPLLWAGRAIPKPEDYILALSQLTLADLYDDPHDAEAPEAAPAGRRQGEANAVVLEAADPSSGEDKHERSIPSLGSRMRALIDAKRRKQNRAPRHAGDIVH